MHKLSLLLRVAFICNVALFLSWLSQFIKFLPAGAISSTVIVMGLGMSFIVNILACVTVLAVFTRKRSLLNDFPRWLIILNFLFLIPQIILLLK